MPGRRVRTLPTLSQRCVVEGIEYQTPYLYISYVRSRLLVEECGRCWVAQAITLHSMADNTIQLWGANLRTHNASHLCHTDNSSVPNKPEIISELKTTALLTLMRLSSKCTTVVDVYIFSFNWDTTVQSLPCSVPAVIRNKGGLKW